MCRASRASPKDVYKTSSLWVPLVIWVPSTSFLCAQMGLTLFISNVLEPVSVCTWKSLTSFFFSKNIILVGISILPKFVANGLQKYDLAIRVNCYNLESLSNVKVGILDKIIVDVSSKRIISIIIISIQMFDIPTKKVMVG